MKKLNDETLEKEKQIYQQAMETYRHFHAFITSGFLVIATIIGAGVVFRWTKEYRLIKCIEAHLSYRWEMLIIILAILLLFLIIYIFYRILKYTIKSRMAALRVAKNIERSWFPGEDGKVDESKILAHRLLAHELWEAEKTSLVWCLIRKFDHEES